MGRSVKVNETVLWIGANDRRTQLFENLWPIEKGVSYNSYLIKDEKVAIVDTVSAGFEEEFISNIKQTIGNECVVDYLIINHMEPDHSGSISRLQKEYPEITIICNKLMSKMLDIYYGIVENLKIIKDGEFLNLGKHQMKFYMTPWLHWPETMMSYDETDKILFSGDAFGSFGAIEGRIFDDEVHLHEIEDDLRRYYSNIVGKFTDYTQKALAKLGSLEMNIIAATHGVVWRKNIGFIISKYNQWSSYQTDAGVVIAYASMYGNTAQMADFIARLLVEKGLKNIKVYDTSKTHMSYIISDIWKYKAVIFASPTYNSHLHPTMVTLLTELKELQVKDRLIGILGTFNWNGAATKEFVKFSEEINWEIVGQPIEIRGALKPEYYPIFEDLAENMIKKLKS